MLEPDKERLRISSCLNGWMVTKDYWNPEQQRWEDTKTWVYQDGETLMVVLREEIMEVPNGQAQS